MNTLTIYYYYGYPYIGRDGLAGVMYAAPVMARGRYRAYHTHRPGRGLWIYIVVVESFTRTLLSLRVHSFLYPVALFQPGRHHLP